MSEYTPITGELREYATVAWDPWPEARGRLYQMCDAIDAVHANLERENAALKAELDRVLGEQEDRRGCIYYDPERHYCSCHDIDIDGWIELPRDEYGKHIRIGDVMEWPTTCETFEVVGIGDGVLFYVEDGNEKADWTGASTKRHHAPDTWERILADALGCDPYEVEGDDDLMAIVARCKALCERTKEDA